MGLIQTEKICMSISEKKDRSIDILSHSEMDDLLVNSSYHSLRKQGIRKITFSLESLSEEENVQLSKRINRFYFSCGCKEGAAALLVSAVAYLSYLYFLSEKNFSTVDVLIGLLILALAMGIGKSLGKFLGRYRFYNALKVIQPKR